MTDHRAVLQRALDALILAAKELGYNDPTDLAYVSDEAGMNRSAIAALRAALAQPEQEPVAWLTTDSQDGLWHPTAFKKHKDDRPLYASPSIPAEPEQEPVARVAEVHMSRYTLEWLDGPLPEGTLLYASPTIPAGMQLVPVERWKNACAIIQTYANLNPKWWNDSIEQDPGGAHAWLAAAKEKP